jgi:transcriptional regulator with XRE-family HTH domain
MNNLKDWRIKTGKAVKDMALTLNVSESYYRDLENGRRRFNEDILNLLFDKFDLSASFVLNHKEEDLSNYNIVVEQAKNSNISPEQLEKLLKHLIAMKNEFN